MLNTTTLFQTILTPFRQYPVESVLILAALILTLLTLSPLIAPSVADEQTILSAETPTGEYEPTPTEEKDEEETIAVEVSGAVLYPDVYMVPAQSRIKDLLKSAGGLTAEADRAYVSRNFNLARYVYDQEKIYIPTTWDIYEGTFVEEKRILSYLDPLQSRLGVPASGEEPEGIRIPINSASPGELDTLPGIGPTTAQKIIDNRPYESLDDLVSRKVVKQNVFDQIKSLIAL